MNGKIIERNVSTLKLPRLSEAWRAVINIFMLTTMSMAA